ncbi:FtsH protease activity modulator HflK [Sphingomonas jaspsi]|uniref:FtsH protease activity modulator HflK n=1 Tax=Sphingomonas jaspsi TaxID=392409 RepID=UPI0004B91BAE|nr:FtsH protease activity modulator HflK [Sphingomonas jaspsi]
MTIFSGWAARGRGFFSDNKGPWGAPPSGNGGNGGGDEPPKGPWGSGGKPRPPRRSGNISSLDEFLQKSRGRFGGSGDGGGFGPLGSPSASLIGWAVLGLVALVLLLSTVHSIAAAERGVVTQFGRYSRTINPGVGFTLPWPIERVQKVDVTDNRRIEVGTTGDQGETLMLTGDQNLIDIAYQVRWNIKNPENYLFELKDPEKTVQQVAESAMRQVIANVSLEGAMGPQRGLIEARVAEEMQRILDGYKSGVQILGISLRQADPPAKVNDAFKEVTAAQQDAQTEINNANAYRLQLKQISEGESAAFDKVYEQYKLAPGVTRRRMYYETMERVLKNVDKTIVETNNVTPYLPLNQVQQGQKEGAR